MILTLAEVGDIVKVLKVVLFFTAKRVALTGRRQCRSLSCELHIEVADIFSSFDCRYERGQDFPLIKCLPVRSLNIQVT